MASPIRVRSAVARIGLVHSATLPRQGASSAEYVIQPRTAMDSQLLSG